MKDAVYEGKLVQAGPDAPTEATCPSCGAEVVLRRRGDTWFYRHADGGGESCPRRTRLGE